MAGMQLPQPLPSLKRPPEEDMNSLHHSLPATDTQATQTHRHTQTHTDTHNKHTQADPKKSQANVQGKMENLGWNNKKMRF